MKPEGSKAPLVLKTTKLAQAAHSAEVELLAGRPPPSGDPPPIRQAPRPSVMPWLSEPRAQAAFPRMMARAARSGSHTQDVTDIIDRNPSSRGEKRQNTMSCFVIPLCLVRLFQTALSDFSLLPHFSHF